MRRRRSEDTVDRPGLVRTVRVDRRVDHLVARANPGDIAVIDVIDLDRGTAEQLVAAGVSAVVNAASSCSGRFPVNGAQTLLEAGVVLVDDVGGEVFSRVRDGDTVRLDGATVYAAGEPVVDGDLQSDESVAASNAAARDGVRDRLGALIADAGRRLADEGGDLLEGDSFPSLVTPLRDRVVVVITAGATAEELQVARSLHRRRAAIVIAVGAGADLAREARLRPDLLIIGRGVTPREGYGRVREVLALDGADLDAPVPTGIPRAHTRSLGSAEDTAVLLAHARGASLVVTLGLDESLGGLLDRSAVAGSLPFVGRLRDAGRHLSAGGAGAALGRVRRSRGRRLITALLLVLALTVAALGGAWLAREPESDGPVASSAGASVSDAAAFERTLTPLLVADRLKGHVVTLVALPGVDPGEVEAFTTSLGQAGASVSGPVVLGSDYVDARQSRVLRDLAIQLAPSAVQTRLRAQPENTPPADQLDEILASALAVPAVSNVGGGDAAVTTLLTGLSRLGGLEPAERQVRAGDAVVLLAPPQASSEIVTRSTVLASAFARHARAVTVVSAGPVTAGAVSTGVVQALRTAKGEPPANLSTVDGGATSTGRAATTLATAEVLGGAKPGAYGAATDAKSGALPPNATR